MARVVVAKRLLLGVVPRLACWAFPTNQLATLVHYTSCPRNGKISSTARLPFVRPAPAASDYHSDLTLHLHLQSLHSPLPPAQHPSANVQPYRLAATLTSVTFKVLPRSSQAPTQVHVGLALLNVRR